MFGWFSKGKVAIQLPKLNYRVGEAVRGSITYSVKKPLHANEVTMQLYAQEKRTQGFGQNRRTTTIKVFDFTVPLSGETELSPSQKYTQNFEITIPQDAVQQKPTSEVANTVLAAASMLARTSKQTKWYIKARVDVKGFDITKKQQINVA